MKRIVFVHRGGLHQILGHAGQLGLTEGDLPPTVVENLIGPGNRLIPFVNLFKMTQHAAFYREPLVPGSYTFHPEQR